MGKVIPCLRALGQGKLERCSDTCPVGYFITDQADWLTEDEFKTKKRALEQGVGIDSSERAIMGETYAKFSRLKIRCPND